MGSSNFILIFLFLFSQSAFADDPYCDEQLDIEVRVIAKAGLIIRDEPSLKGKVLAHIPFWGKLQACSFGQRDTIDSIPGFWTRVKHENIEGYMFDGYLITIDSSYDKFKSYRIFDGGCASVNYDPDLHWYGVYHAANGDSLVKVDLEIRKRKVDEEEAIDFIVTTNKYSPDKHIFFVGSKVELKEKLAQLKNVIPEVGSLYPGQRSFIYNPYSSSVNNSLELNAIGTVTGFKSEGSELENYRLRLTSRQDISKTQDITDDLVWMGEGGMTVKPLWFGDIDDDLKPDVLFVAYSTSHGQVTLFLSSEANGDNFVQKVDVWKYGNCY